MSSYHDGMLQQRCSRNGSQGDIGDVVPDGVRHGVRHSLDDGGATP